MEDISKRHTRTSCCISGLLFKNNEEIDIKILNISQSGALIKTNNDLKINEKYLLICKILNEKLNFVIEIIRKNKNLYGIKFIDPNSYKKEIILRFQINENENFLPYERYSQTFHQNIIFDEIFMNKKLSIIIKNLYKTLCVFNKYKMFNDLKNILNNFMIKWNIK